MMPRIVRACFIAGALSLALASPGFAQIDANLGALTPENVKGYLQPLPKALSSTLNMAAFQSANAGGSGVAAGAAVAVGAPVAVGGTVGKDPAAARNHDSNSLFGRTTAMAKSGRAA